MNFVSNFNKYWLNCKSARKGRSNARTTSRIFKRICNATVATHESDETIYGDDISTTITSGDQIQLDSYKCIPEFCGVKSQYRSWREQVVRRMKMIAAFKTHPKYEAALGIIRSKIKGPASDVLINNKTPYNIDAIINRFIVCRPTTTLRRGSWNDMHQTVK